MPVSQPPATSPADLTRRIEEASLNAWPALHQMLVDGWVLRFSKGFTRRGNCVTPVYSAERPFGDKVDFCERLYAREGLPTLFKLTTSDSELDDMLAERGYSRGDACWLMLCDLATHPSTRTPGFSVVQLPEFLETYTELTELRGHMEGGQIDPQIAVQLHGTVLQAIRTETVFGILNVNDEPVACGVAVVEGDLAGLFDIVTHPRKRRRGYGRELVRSLMAQATGMSASRAYLQVLQDNTPAIALYEELGFETLYRYWYRSPT